MFPDTLIPFFTNTVGLYLDAAPWLLLGLLAAGLIKGWVPESAMHRWLGGSGIGPVTRAALVGAPLPLCSCGVLPAALGLHRSGASRGSTLSFLIATPETGVDSVAVTYALMGPFMAVVRPVAAIASAICTGLLGGWGAGRPAPNPPPAPGAGSCCGCNTSCGAPSAPAPGWRGRTVDGLRYAVNNIVDDIIPWLAAGLLLAGLLMTLVPVGALAAWGSGLPAMLLMLLVGIPMYICATASTPLAASLLLLGVSPGTVLVFLLAGPATNLATLGLLYRELGRRTLVLYLCGIAVTSVTAGLLVDAIVAGLGIDVAAQMADATELVPSVLAWASGIILALLAIRPLRRQLVPAGTTGQ